MHFMCTNHHLTIDKLTCQLSICIYFKVIKFKLKSALTLASVLAPAPAPAPVPASALEPMQVRILPLGGLLPVNPIDKVAARTSILRYKMSLCLYKLNNKNFNSIGLLFLISIQY